MGTLLILTTLLPFTDDCPELLNFSTPRLTASANSDFCDAFVGEALLVVNTTSQCGFTSQFQQLEGFYQTYKAERLNCRSYPMIFAKSIGTQTRRRRSVASIMGLLLTWSRQVQ